MEKSLRKMAMSCNKALTDAAILFQKHKKAITFTYLFALLFSCGTSIAFADEFDNYPLWKTTQAVLDVIFPLFVVIGVLLVILGIILLLINRFNEQSLTGPLIILAVGVVLIVVRAFLGDFISEIAFEQMYPKAEWNNGKPFDKQVTNP